MGDQKVIEVERDWLTETEKKVQNGNIGSLEELIISLISSDDQKSLDLIGIATKKTSSELNIIRVGTNKIVEKLLLPAAGSAVGEAIVKDTYILENAIGKYSEFFDIRELHQNGYSSLLILPLTSAIGKCAVFVACKRAEAFGGLKEMDVGMLAGRLSAIVSMVNSYCELNDLRIMLKSFFDPSSEIVFLVDGKDCRIINASNGACEIMGLEPEKLLGSKISEVIISKEDNETLVKTFIADSGKKSVHEFAKEGGNTGILEIMPWAINLRDKTLVKLTCTEVTQKLLYEDLYVDIADSLPVISITLNEEGNIVLINNEVKSLGYDKTELINGPISRVVCETDYPVLDGLLQGIKSGQEVMNDVELRLVTKDGRLKFFKLNGKAHYDSSGRLIKSNWLALNVDEGKGEERQTLAEILRNSSDCVYIFDAFGLIRFWNKRAEEILGYSEGEAIGKDVRILFPNERKTELDHVVKTLNNSEKLRPFETVRLRKNGERVHVNVTSTAIFDNDGKVSGYMDIAMDISDKKAVEEAEAAKRRLEERNRNLVRLNEMRSEFISHVSHELKTPLTSIHGYTSLLLDGEGGTLTDQQRSYIQVVVDETTRLTKLINDVLDLSKIDSGKFKLAYAYFDLKELVERCSCTSLAQEKNLYVKWNIAEDVPSVYGDRNKIAQVFINLVSNAIKFTDNGGITVNAIRKGRSYVQVDVIDTGRGIPQEDRDKIFKRFYQSSVITMKEGTGLGLSISREIIKLHWGNLRLAESEVGKGSRFTFELRTKEKKERQLGSKENVSNLEE